MRYKQIINLERLLKDQLLALGVELIEVIFWFWGRLKQFAKDALIFLVPLFLLEIIGFLLYKLWNFIH